MNADLAGESYWNKVWTAHRRSRVAALNFGYWRFTRLLLKYCRRGSVACEVGCAGSVWLPRLARAGVRIRGVDYSAPGMRHLEEQLRAISQDAELVCGDVFDTTKVPARWADVVFSLGFIEHFSDPSNVMARLSAIVRPGGYVITLVPNLVGWWGPIQKWLNAEVYGLHVRYDAAMVDRVHRDAGLEAVEPASYFGGFGLCSLNYSRQLRRWPHLIRWTMRAAWVIQQAVCWICWPLPGGGESRRWSAYVVGVYRRPVT